MEKLHAGHPGRVRRLGKGEAPESVVVWGGEKGHLEECSCGLSHGA